LAFSGLPPHPYVVLLQLCAIWAVLPQFWCNCPAPIIRNYLQNCTVG
jgi:hypothetical protein